MRLTNWLTKFWVHPEWTTPPPPPGANGEIIADADALDWQIGTPVTYTDPSGKTYRCKVVDREPVEHGAYRYTVEPAD
jgi:hypothetical protein